MSDERQVFVPRSFIDLFVPPGRVRPTASREHIETRHDLCEDLAQMLAETARDRLHELHVTEADVLDRVLRGLLSGDAVDEAEARWVVRRLAEVLDWPPLA